MCLTPTVLLRRPGINPRTGKQYPPVSASWIRDNGLDISAFVECAVPCGKCFECLKSKARDLLVRAYHESRCHEHSSFVTLTVDDDHLDEVFPGGSLSHRPYQLFFKRLRKASKVKLRYLMCAEYGETTCRPHYHCIIFGLCPDERRPLAIVKTDPLLGSVRSLYSGFYDNRLIRDAWPFGHVYVGSATPASIAYCTGYTLKSYTLGRDPDWYKARNLTPEYIKWSRRPGLGVPYLDKNISDWWRCTDLYNSRLADNTAIVSGHPVALPRAYVNRIEYCLKNDRPAPLQYAEKFDTILASRQEMLAQSSATPHSACEDEQSLSVLVARHEKRLYDVARRKRL